MKKNYLFLLIWGLLFSIPVFAQSQISDKDYQKQKVQQLLNYYHELAKNGDTKAKKKEKYANEFLQMLDRGGQEVLARTRAAEANTYVDTVCNVNYSYNPEDGTASVVSSDPKDSVAILESFTVDGKTYTVTSIGPNVFKSRRIQSLFIPKSVTSISSNAFYISCKNLTNIKVDENNPVYDSRNNCNAIIDTTNTLVWGCKGTIIPDGVVAIGDDAFHYTESPEHLTFPASIVRIGDDSFAQGDNLKTVHIPSTLTEFYHLYNPFWGCRNLSEITVDENNPKYDSRNNCNAIIETETNILFVGCNGTTVIPDGIVEVTWQALYIDCVLQSLHIPASVISLDFAPLEFCTILNGITVDPANLIFDSRNNCNLLIETSTNKLLKGCQNSFIPEGILSIAFQAFADLKELTAIELPESLTEIGAFAFCASGLKYIKIPENVTKIEASAFNYTYQLDSIVSYILYPFEIPNNVFYNYNKLYVPQGTSGLYHSVEGWNKFENIIEMEGGEVFSFHILDDKENDVTNNCTIVWYDTDGKQIGKGITLGGVADSTVVYYSVILNEDLGRKYREINKQKLVVERKPLTCKLELIGKVNLTGRVSVLEIDSKQANIQVVQHLNGKYEEVFNTNTDEKGTFAIEVFDDVTDITISRDDCIHTTLHRDMLSRNEDLGTIPLSLISGFPISVEISYISAVSADETAEETAWNDGLGNLDFTLINETTNAQITDFAVQNNTLIVKSGASVGDKIGVSVKSRKNEFCNANASLIVAADVNILTLQLKELGGINVTYTNSSSGNNVATLYDTDGLMVSRAAYSGQSLSMTHLSSGTYNLVSMQRSDLFNGVTKLSELSSIGLQDGKDYVTTQVVVNDGILSVVNVNEIPTMDERAFYYTNTNTYFNTNKSEVTVGHYITLSAHIELKATYAHQLNDAFLYIDIPEDCQMVNGSVMVGAKMATYTQEGNRITIPLTRENYQDKIRFCIIPLSNREYNITAYASLNMGNQALQPIGTAQFTGKGLSISVPTQYASTKVKISGTALGASDVKIFDNDVLIGNASSKMDGSWSTEVELDKPYNPSYHEIYARIINSEGIELNSETRLLLYDKDNIVPNKAVMSFYNGWYKKNIEVVFDLNSGTTTPSSYPFYKATDFTFTADFTLNDTTRVKNVNFKVLASDGTIRTIPGTFDSKKQAWVGTTTYSSSNKLPENVTMEYDVIPADTPFDPARINDDNNQFINLIKDYVANIDTTKFEIIDAKDSMAICKYQTYTMEKPVFLRIAKIDYNSNISEMQENDTFIYENEGKTTYMRDSTYADKTVVWLWSKEDKFMLEVAFSEGDYSSSPKTRIGYTIANGFVTLLDSYFTGQKIRDDYQRGLRERDNLLRKLYNIQIDHGKIYNKTQQLLYAKCPDGTYKTRYIDFWTGRLQECRLQDLKMYQDFDLRIGWVERDIKAKRNVAIAINSVISISSLFLPETIIGENVGKSLGSGLSKLFKKTIPNWISARVIPGATDGVVSAVGGHGITALLDNFFNRAWYTCDKLNEWYNKENKDIISKYIDLQNSIVNDYKKCEKKKEENDDDKKEENKYNEEYNDTSKPNNPEFSNPATLVILDPSGYVYEAVQSNRLEGVTVTVYHKEQTEDMYGETHEETVKWDAEAYSQKNPLVTDAAGFYSWDVPQGQWQVKYEKEGYETTYSDWLPVPPPQLDVNVGMKQSIPPSVKQMRGYESGITINMSKFMRPTSLSQDNITVTCNGMSTKGTIDLLDSEKEPYGESVYASKMKFIPETPFNTSDEVVVTVRKAVESYCGVNMETDIVQTVKIEAEIKEIVTDSIISVPYQNSKDIQIVALPKSAAAGKVLHIQSSSDIIASMSKSEIELDDNGSAIITLQGELPGSAYITFTIDETDLTATSKVKVITDDDIVATPMASVKSGETIDAGTQISLTCSTEGATIYYTLDGSCPCDEATRIKYENPIVVNSDVVIKAIAIKDDMEDSDIATFVYVLNSSGIVDIESGIRIWPYVTSSAVNIDLNDKKAETITVFNLNGIVVSSMSNVEGRVSVNLGKYADGMYMVNVKYKNNKVVRKIIKVGRMN